MDHFSLTSRTSRFASRVYCTVHITLAIPACVSRSAQTFPSSTSSDGEEAPQLEACVLLAPPELRGFSEAEAELKQKIDMTGIFRGLVLSLAVACALLQAADAASCTDDLDCPLKQCCTGTHKPKTLKLT
eukprot:jgi/Mesen1/6444/ME000033S05726